MTPPPRLVIPGPVTTSDRNRPMFNRSDNRRTTPMALAFTDALDDAQTAITGYATGAAPVVAAVAVLFLGIKYIRRIVSSL